jgi:hypothetical protein
MKKLFFLLITTCLMASAFAQLTISGQVIDAETKQPLEGASVFAQNTTIGTITNKEGQFKLSLSKGGYELVVTYTGYKNGQKDIVAGNEEAITIELQKEDQSMSEVVITSSNEVADGWQQYGDFFIKHFIGATSFADSCTIQNPEVLKFYYYKRSDKIKVLATEALQITNRALGYNLRYNLDSFVHYNKTNINTYRGLCLYQPLEGTEEEQQQWAANRKAAYKGSRLHFLRAYYDSTLKEEGFTVDLLSSTNLRKFNRLLNPYDSAYYLVDDTTADVELWFPTKASITYNKQKPEQAYLQQSGLPLDVGVQISYVDLLDAILIKPNGFFLSQRSWVNQGYWSWKNLADQLPYDYEPE